MKKILMIITMLVMTLQVSTFAQTLKQMEKINAKAAKKEAKALSKEGWSASVGALPLERQLYKMYMMREEETEDGQPKYYISEARSIGETYNGAKFQATEIAKLTLAGLIQTDITALIDNTLANQGLGQEEAATLERSVAASKNLISQSLGRIVVAVEAYRVLKNKNTEVMVTITYDIKAAKAAAVTAVKKDLAKTSDDLHDKLDKLMGL